MDEAEARIDVLVKALADVHVRLVRLASELMRRPEWSGVTYVLEPSEWNRGTPRATLGFGGYVDGELAEFGGLAWTIDVSRESGAGWLVEREMVMNVTSFQETFRAFEAVRVADSFELARVLPRLTEQLLEVAPPT
jgi:hypothetical protein